MKAQNAPMKTTVGDSGINDLPKSRYMPQLFTEILQFSTENSAIYFLQRLKDEG